MKIAVVSDIHANLEAFTAVLADIRAARVDAILCCGDFVGYFANPNECIRLAREHQLLAVAGNHDLGVVLRKSLDRFWDVAANAILWTRPRLASDCGAWLDALPRIRAEFGCLLFHGALHPDDQPEDLHLEKDADIRLTLEALSHHSSRCRVAFYGHTHRQSAISFHAGEVRLEAGSTVHLSPAAWYLVNPGSVGLPRDGDPRAAWLLYDQSRGTLSFRRTQYDRAPCVAKARREGLLKPGSMVRLAWRLRNKVSRLLLGRDYGDRPLRDD
jgi:predicted phosphodiesterase